VLPCSILDVPTIAFGDLRQLGIDSLELLVDYLLVLESQADLLLRLWAKSIIAWSLCSIVLSDAFQAFDLVRGCAAPAMRSGYLSLQALHQEDSPVPPGHVPSRLFILSVEQCVRADAQLTLGNLHFGALASGLLASCLAV
jgi:hypothetical protein